MRSRPWKSKGTSPAFDGTPATAGASRIYYENERTGERCYRSAAWRGVHFFDYGDGVGLDVATGQPNGRTYPAEEFR
jgi:hypothetical protein